MKNSMKLLSFPILLIFSILLLSCSKDNNNDADKTDDSCYVQLFDGDNYTEDNIIVKGPGEYSNLKNLPGATKDWDDEADSFKSGKNTTVTFWTETDFKGDKVTYKKGEQKPSIDEPRSMKIECNK